MRYKVGDIVRVRDDLYHGGCYDNDSQEEGRQMLFTLDMEKWCGQYVEIIELTPCPFKEGIFYKIKGATEYWTDQMFDEVLCDFYFDPIECSIESILF